MPTHVEPHLGNHSVATRLGSGTSGAYAKARRASRVGLPRPRSRLETCGNDRPDCSATSDAIVLSSRPSARIDEINPQLVHDIDRCPGGDGGHLGQIAVVQANAPVGDLSASGADE
jgi:hypothetical protein